jgi:hypothetical protein
MTKITIGNKEVSIEELAAKENARLESQREYHAKRNALTSKLFAFYREYSGKCEELDAFMSQ